MLAKCLVKKLAAGKSCAHSQVSIEPQVDVHFHDTLDQVVIHQVTSSGPAAAASTLFVKKEFENPILVNKVSLNSLQMFQLFLKFVLSYTSLDKNFSG